MSDVLLSDVVGVVVDGGGGAVVVVGEVSETGGNAVVVGAEGAVTD